MPAISLNALRPRMLARARWFFCAVVGREISVLLLLRDACSDTWNFAFTDYPVLGGGVRLRRNSRARGSHVY